MKKDMIAVVIPSDPISVTLKSFSEQEVQQYFNPGNIYKKVYVVSRHETGVSNKCGMTIIGADIYNARKIIKKISPNIVRVYDGFYSSDYACSNRVKGIPIICSVHDKRKELIFKSLKYADGIICVSQIVADAVIEKVKGIDKDKIIVIPNRIDTKLFKNKSDPILFSKLNGLFPTTYHILHVGRKVVEKNIDTVVKALKFLPKEYSAIFIGGGDFSPYYRLAQTLKVEDRCYNLEIVKHKNLPFFYSWCSCMCVPSRTEGFGFVFVEAASCGSAIITTDSLPMSGYLENNQSACLIKEFEDPKILAQAIRKTCEDKEYSERLRKNAIKVGGNFSKDNVDKIENCFIRSIKPDKNNERCSEIIRYFILIKYLYLKCRIKLSNLIKGK